MLVHLVSRSLHPIEPLASHEACGWLWQRLRGAFPLATDCTLMPSGVHLIVDAAEPWAARGQLAHVLGGFGRRYGSRLWERVPAPAIIPNRKHLWRQSRYVALNPCRDGLARDPLEWAFSTYRDVMGAVVDPWIEAKRLAEAHGLPANGFRERYHRYVSGDPSVAVQGTPLPRAAARNAPCVHPLQRIVLAAAAATRSHPDAVRRRGHPRRLFVALAHDQGWTTGRIAAACGLSDRQARRVNVEPLALQAGRICLGDERLLMATRALEPIHCPAHPRTRSTRNVRRHRWNGRSPHE